MRILFAAIFCVSLLGCGDGGGRYYDGSDYDYMADAEAEADARTLAEEELAEEAVANAEASDVSEYDVASISHTGCTYDCGGHEAGEEWARENDISDEYDCRGNSRSFIEGCEAFVEARQEVAEEQAREAAIAEAEEAADYEAEYERDYEEDAYARRGY